MYLVTGYILLIILTIRNSIKEKIIINKKKGNTKTQTFIFLALSLKCQPLSYTNKHTINNINDIK
jgi:hypothetical protein